MTKAVTLLAQGMEPYMARDTPREKASAPTPAEPTDAELDALKLAKAKLALRQDIAGTQASALASLDPSVTDAPKGEVTLGENAGSLGPWLAHRVIAEAGDEIATSVSKLSLIAGARVLVTDDAALLASDVLTRQVLNAMTARTIELGRVGNQASTALTTLRADIVRYTLAETPPATDTADADADTEVGKTLELATGLQGASLKALVEMVEDVKAAAPTKAPEAEAGTEEEATAAPEDAAGGSGSPFAVAVDLVRLLATDFTLTSVTVPATSRTLTTATAGKLAEVFARDSRQAAKQVGSAAEEYVRAQAAREAAEVAKQDAPADKQVRAADVVTQAAKVAERTAEQLAAVRERETPKHVILDGFTVTPRDSSTLSKFDGLTSASYETALKIQKLKSKAAGVAAEAVEYKAVADKLQTAWTAATTNKSAAAGSADKIKAALDEVTTRATRRTSAAAAAQTAAESAESVVTAAATELTKLTTADANGVVPLIRACSREGLHTDFPSIQHILLVEARNAGADVVTRHSVLGSSGRVSYLAGTNTTWAVVDVVTGQMRGGGSQRPARQMTHDLNSGKAITSLIVDNGDLGDDPLAKNEKWIRAAVLILAVGIALLGLAAVVNVVGSLL